MKMHALGQCQDQHLVIFLNLFFWHDVDKVYSLGVSKGYYFASAVLVMVFHPLQSWNLHLASCDPLHNIQYSTIQPQTLPLILGKYSCYFVNFLFLCLVND